MGSSSTAWRVLGLSVLAFVANLAVVAPASADPLLTRSAARRMLVHYAAARPVVVEAEIYTAADGLSLQYPPPDFYGVRPQIQGLFPSIYDVLARTQYFLIAYRREGENAYDEELVFKPQFAYLESRWGHNGPNYDIPIGMISVGAVTGIMKLDATHAQVEFACNTKRSALGAVNLVPYGGWGVTLPFDSDSPNLLNPSLRLGNWVSWKGTCRQKFALYDDGWRIDDGNG